MGEMHMSEMLAMSGGWFWFIVAGLLLIGELLSPGVFLIWLAGAAALTGVVDRFVVLSWQSEVALFAVLAVALVFASWNWVKAQRSTQSDQPHLNQRHGAYVGRVFVLDRAIINGSGKLRIEDAIWDVDGPDLPVGARVKVTGVNGLRLNAVGAE
jgi:inner membrane protein